MNKLNRIVNILSLMILIINISKANEYYVYYEGRKLKMHEEPHFIAIKLKENTAETEKNKIQKITDGITKQKGFFNAASEKRNGKYDVIVIELNNKALERQNELNEKLSKFNSIEHIGKCFKYNDKVLHFSIGEVIVKFKNNVTLSAVNNLCKIFKSEIVTKLDEFGNTYLIKLNDSTSDNVFDLANKFSLTDFTEFAHPNFLRTGMLLNVPIDDDLHKKYKERVKQNSKNNSNELGYSYIPNDTMVPRMWHLNNTGNNIPDGIVGSPGCDMNMFNAWELSKGNPNVMISITDTGIDTNHIDLRPNLCDRRFWYDAYDNDQTPFDEYYHGTGVSGASSAAGNNIAGTAGVAFLSQIMPVRVFGPYPQAFTTDLILAKGLNWSWKHGASVINCSWGGGIPGSLITFAIQNAVNYGRSGRGCVIAGGSGNGDTNIVIYPASMPEVIGVGGLSPCFQRKSKTSCDNIGGVQNWGACYGEGMELVAPCTYIGTTELFGGWCICGNGTSSSSPLAAGVAALIISRNVNLSGDSVKMIMEKYARKVGSYNYNIPKEHGMWNEEMGYGMIDARACLENTPPGPENIYDQVPPIITIYPPESKIYTSVISVDAEITDNIGINNTAFSPRLYYKTLQSGNIQTILGTKLQNDLYRFTFPLIPYSEGLYYYIAAQDLAEVPNFATYPIGGYGINPPGNTPPPKYMFVRNTKMYDTSFASSDVPIRITSERETSFVSVLNINESKLILDVNVLVNIEHTFDADLSFSLISPSGTEIVLAGGVGLDGDNFTNTIFDDEANISIDSSLAEPPFTGRFKPIDKLWLFDGENSYGLWQLRVTDNGVQDGGWLLGWTVYFKFSTEGNNVNLPTEFSLVKNYPNPFNPKTRIVFNVPKTAQVKITIYDITGKEVKTLLNEQRNAALEDYVDFDASNLASGVYFCTMTADGNFIDSKKLVFVK
jgi:subtilisin family serine protease/subtilisin-like proprotein convertase family protein